jgi:hypothetical protein
MGRPCASDGMRAGTPIRSAVMRLAGCPTARSKSSCVTESSSPTTTHEIPPGWTSSPGRVGPPSTRWSVVVLTVRRPWRCPRVRRGGALRGLTGPFMSLIQREEHMRHLTGVPHILGLLTTVFPAETGSRLPAKQGDGPSAPNRETESPHCLRYRPPERACFPSASSWPNSRSREPDFCTPATTGVGPKT